MKTKRALLICYSFPPSTHSNAQRPGLVAEALLKDGWKVDVLTSRYAVQDKQKEELNRSGLTITRLDSWFERLMQNRCMTSWLELFLQRMFSCMLWPDKRIPWIRRVDQHLKDTSTYQLLILCIVPVSSLSLASKRSDFDKRWILDYQEPVCPEMKLYPSHLWVQRIGFKQLWRVEKKALDKCGLAVFSCGVCRDAYVDAGLIESSRSLVVSHSYNPDSFNGATADRQGNFHIVYTGSFHGSKHGDRSPRQFLKAFRIFLDRNPEASAESKFILYGRWLKEHDPIISEYHLEDYVDLRAPVSGETYYQVLKESPALLLVTSKRHNLHVPGKLVDYLGANRPVLSFVPDDSEAAAILTACGLERYLLSPDDHHGAEVIAELWRDFKNDTLKVDPEKTVFWSSDVQMERMTTALNNYITNRIS